MGYAFSGRLIEMDFDVVVGQRKGQERGYHNTHVGLRRDDADVLEPEYDAGE